MKSTIKTHLAILLLAGIGSSGLHAQQSPPKDPYRTVLVSGTVEAAESTKVENETGVDTRIVRIVEEGTMVKKGDLLIELDSHALTENTHSTEISILQAANALAKANGDVELAKIINEFAMKVVRNALQTAEANLKNFQAAGMKTTAEDLQARVAVARERIRAAEKILALKGNPALQVAVINAQVTLLEAQRVLKLAQAELKQFQDHTAPQKLRNLKLSVTVAHAEIHKTEVKNKANLDVSGPNVLLAKNNLRALETKLADQKAQLAKAKIFAPMDGVVVYFVTASSRYGASSGIIEKGAAVRKGQGILQIIDITEMNVSVKVPGSKILLVNRGAPVSVKLASLPGQSIRGVVSYVAPVASAAERWGSGQRVYKTEIRLLNPPEHIRPGESVIAEIAIKIPRPGGINTVPSRRPQIERPGSGSTRPGGGGARPGGGGRPGGGSSLFKAPDELKLTVAQKQKWDQVEKSSNTALDAAMQQRDFSKLRTIRDDFDKEIKKILTATQQAQYEKIRSARRTGGGSRRGVRIMDMDTDKDGKVSKAEYGKMSERARQFMGEFSALDTNGDGGITKEEADAARQKLLDRLRSVGSPTPPKEDPKK